MTEEQIFQIQHEIESGMDKENALLAEIEQLADSITNRLMKTNHVPETFMGVKYIFSLDANKEEKRITVMRTNPLKLAIAGGKYRPGIFTAEWNTEYTYYENVYAAVKAAICSAAGIINVEELN